MLEFRSSQLNHHVAAFHLQRIDRELRGRIVCGLTGLEIPLPPMPGTNQFVSLNHTLPQRPAAVQADIVHRRDRPVYVGDADHFVTTRKFPGFAFGRKSRLSCEPYEVRHEPLRKLNHKAAELRSARTAGRDLPDVVCSSADD